MAEEEQPSAEEQESTGEASSSQDEMAGEGPEPRMLTDDELSQSYQRLSLNSANQEIVGRLVVHYAARDVELWIDGDAAARILASYQQGRAGVFNEVVNPLQEVAEHAWVVLEIGESVLAMSWLPGVPSLPVRMAVDPSLVVPGT